MNGVDRKKWEIIGTSARGQPYASLVTSIVFRKIRAAGYVWMRLVSKFLDSGVKQFGHPLGSAKQISGTVFMDSALYVNTAGWRLTCR